jgi:hypothetical protein
MALGSTQPLTEKSTRNLPWGKWRPAHKADNPTTICELYQKCGSLSVSQIYGPPQPITGTALPFYHILTHKIGFHPRNLKLFIAIKVCPSAFITVALLSTIFWFMLLIRLSFVCCYLYTAE